MGHDWIIDVLADMRRFARQNDMPLLCAQLDDAMMVASAEVANMPAQPSLRSEERSTKSGPHLVK